MVNFKQIEEDAVKALQAVVHEAAANEPTIGALVRTALEGTGVPPILATGAVDMVEGLIAHFSSAHATTVAPTTANVASGASLAVSAPAPTSTASIASTSEAAVPADPFAPAPDTEPSSTPAP